MLHDERNLTQSSHLDPPAPPPSNNLRGYLLIAAATLSWGASATLGKAVFTGLIAGGTVSKLDPLILAQARTGISLLILAPLLLIARGRSVFLLPRRDILRCMWLGLIGLAGSNFMYYYAIEKTSVSTAIVLQYTSPVWVLLYMLARRFQKPSLARIGAVAMAVLGISLADDASDAVALHHFAVLANRLHACPDFHRRSTLLSGFVSELPS